MLRILKIKLREICSRYLSKLLYHSSSSKEVIASPNKHTKAPAAMPMTIAYTIIFAP